MAPLHLQSIHEDAEMVGYDARAVAEEEVETTAKTERRRIREARKTHQDLLAAQKKSCLEISKQMPEELQISRTLQPCGSWRRIPGEKTVAVQRWDVETACERRVAQDKDAIAWLEADWLKRHDAVYANRLEK